MSKQSKTHFILTLALVVLGALLILESCGSNSTSSSTPTSSSNSGSVTTSISDPPVCAAPNGGYSHVWVTVTKVTANISSDAGSNDSGFVTLADLSSSPKQIDLLSLASTTCVLTQLGSTTGLAPGNYQQIRIYLLANNAKGAAPSPNQCGAAGFNCVVLSDGATDELELSSEAQTGIKIPSGQIAGGGVMLAAGQSADININLDTCDSLVAEGNGKFRLKPVLHAGEVSVNTNSIGGKVVDSNTQSPIADAMVMLEQPDAAGVDRVVEAEMTASDGSFIFCPLSAGDYDVVAAAGNSVPPGSLVPQVKPYDTTVTFHVPVGSSVNVPLVAGGIPTVINGLVTTVSTASTATAADISVSALQQAAPLGGSVVSFTVPSLPLSITTLATAPGVTSSGSACPASTDCASYTLVVPAANPSVGTFSASGTTYSAPAAGNVPYTVDAQAFLTDGSGTPNCSPSGLMTTLTSGGGPLLAAAGATVTAQTLAFSSCQ